MSDLGAEASSARSRDSVPVSDTGAKSEMSTFQLVLLVLAIALAAKFVVFGLSVGTSMTLSVPNAENWQDYSYAYLTSVQAFKGGHLPYADFYFAYPPLFLYALTAFSYLGQAWAAALPSVIADALTAVPVFLIARRFVGDRGGFLAAAVFSLAPTNLYYADYLWLNPPLTTMFLLVSLYLFLEGRYGFSAVTIALSIGFKQTALFVLPILLIFLWRRTSGRQAIKYLLLVALLCFAFSLPYVFISPGQYLFSIFRLPLYGHLYLPQNYYQLIAPTGPVQTVNNATYTGYFHAWNTLTYVNAPVSLILPFFVFLAPWAHQAFSTANLALTAMLGVAYLVLLYKAYRAASTKEGSVLLFATLSLLVLFAIYPLYKYYLVGATPLLVLLAADKRGLAAFLGLNVVILLIPRIVASYVPLALLLLLLFPPLVTRQRGTISKKAQ